MSDKIPEAELEVLACLDRLGSATVRRLRESMASYRPMAHGSMVTLLKRLQGRDLVDRQKGSSGKAFVYSTSSRSTDVLASALGRIRERVYGGDSVALVASLFETAPPDEQQLAELQELLDSLRDQERGP